MSYPPRPFCFDRAPDCMLVERRWVGWRLEHKPGQKKPTKVPYQTNGAKAASTRPETWASWREAVDAVPRHGLTGIGFVLGGGWLGVDVDAEVADWQMSPFARSVADELGGYCEISPSGTGIHILIRGQMPEGGGRKKRIELYGGGRFFTFTGWFLGHDQKNEDGYYPTPPDPAEPTPEQLKAFYDKHFPPEVVKEFRGGGGLGALRAPSTRVADGHEFDPAQLSDDDLIHKIRLSKQGAKFEALFDGNWRQYFGSQSEADASLVSMLRWWTKDDLERVDRLFRRSKLFRPKWNERRGELTYGQRTIHKIG